MPPAVEEEPEYIERRLMEIGRRSGEIGGRPHLPSKESQRLSSFGSGRSAALSSTSSRTCTRKRQTYSLSATQAHSEATHQRAYRSTDQRS